MSSLLSPQLRCGQAYLTSLLALIVFVSLPISRIKMYWQGCLTGPLLMYFF